MYKNTANPPVHNLTQLPTTVPPSHCRRRCPPPLVLLATGGASLAWQRSMMQIVHQLQRPWLAEALAAGR